MYAEETTTADALKAEIAQICREIPRDIGDADLVGRRRATSRAPALIAHNIVSVMLEHMCEMKSQVALS